MLNSLQTTFSIMLGIFSNLLGAAFFVDNVRKYIHDLLSFLGFTLSVACIGLATAIAASSPDSSRLMLANTIATISVFLTVPFLIIASFNTLGLAKTNKSLKNYALSWLAALIASAVTSFIIIYTIGQLSYYLPAIILLAYSFWGPARSPAQPGKKGDVIP